MFPTDHKTPRFKCHCLPGYTGNLCQNVVNHVKSCRGYKNGSRNPGVYKIFDNNMKLFDVYCDFDLNSSLTWTLIQSYQLKNNSLFKKQPLTNDFPFNQNTPRWDAYRLSKSRMQSIQEDSGKFRVTCNYNTDGVVYRDYLQAAFSHIDLLTLEFEGCMLVERIDVRGQSCQNCTAYIRQTSTKTFHFDSYYVRHCQFKPSGGKNCAHIGGEDNFGRYSCVRRSHRCSSSPSATTQIWFGGQ